jgi:hypothetical protein
LVSGMQRGRVFEENVGREMSKRTDGEDKVMAREESVVAVDWACHFGLSNTFGEWRVVVQTSLLAGDVNTCSRN